MNTLLKKTIKYKTTIHTPLGDILAISDNNFLYLLQFTDSPRLEQQVKKLESAIELPLREGITNISTLIRDELSAYFAGKLEKFATPLCPSGTDFQKQAWHTISTVPYSKTISYTQQAQALNKSSACRAVANANGANPLVIVIPCHRIVSKNNSLGGYSAGLERKRWLLNHEQQNHLFNSKN
ncbi:MAG: methylated-DNA--[protein]-cysteine S-methyltransferase [Epsilonproteobacteria bacterium]|nr:methylated-DNA--[protein]-cysteine S-methyltransferase [Campylobacterota bacterium]